MKKLLSKLVLIFCFALIVFPGAVPAFAQPTVSPSPSPIPLGSSPVSVQQGTTSVPPNTWVQDADVTFAGKAGRRAGEFLDWALRNYDWVCLKKVNNTCNNADNPIREVWLTISKIVYAFFALFLLITAFILIITQGKSITVRKFITRFIFMVLLVVFTYAIIQLLYIMGDIIQGMFLTNPDPTTVVQHPQISQENLLYIGFDYPNFMGYRLFGIQYDESAFISLLLVKLTALTYYVMVGILLIRKIILWFFIIISPIFPLLLLYAPIRNTGKIWIGEFFRWLLYAPLFAIFLSGLVHIWRSTNGIPLPFHFPPANVDSTQNPYQTSINILLGGPGQTLSQTNSVNNPDTFAQYVVALLMLWVVIILPFLLLQIFLDYLKNVSFADNGWVKQMVSTGSSFLGGPPKGNPPMPPEKPGSTGLARQIPFASKIAIPDIAAIKQGNIESVNIKNVETSRVSSEILKLTNLQIPTIRDIAKYESSMMSRDISRHEEVAKVHESLERIAKPQTVSSPAEKARYDTVRQKLVSEGQKGNPVATSILNAANVVGKTATPTQADVNRLQTVLQAIMNPSTVTTTVDKQKYQAVNAQLSQASASGNQLAKDIVKAGTSGKLSEDLAQRLLDAKEKGNSLASVILQAANVSFIAGQTPIPVINRVQQVSLDDYEAVKKMWSENYQKIEPPKTASGIVSSRPEWLKNEMGKITDTITLLLSPDPQKNSKGMAHVGAILPFLLIGGFSKSEIVAYLKAKFEAAKGTLETIEQKSEEEETKLDRQEKKQEKPKEMKAEAAEELPLDDVKSKEKK